MTQVDDLSRSLAAFDQHTTLVVGNRCEWATSRQQLVMADTGAEITGRAVQWIVTGIRAGIKAGIKVEPYRRIEVITGPVRRRRWTADEKARILIESLAPGARI